VGALFTTVSSITVSRVGRVSRVSRVRVTLTVIFFTVIWAFLVRLSLDFRLCDHLSDAFLWRTISVAGAKICRIYIILLKLTMSEYTGVICSLFYLC